jgi:hypothetical protein
MNDNKYKYNFVKESIIYINNEFKKKGQEYGIITLNINQIDILADSLDLMSVSPEISFKFSERIERFLIPRFNELTQIIYSNKSYSSEIGIEVSKENINDIIIGFGFSNVKLGIRDKGYSSGDLVKVLKRVKFTKYK